MIREVVREADPAVAVTELRSMSAVIDRTIAQEKMLARLASWLGVLALTLGAIGIYGVRAYTVNQRAGEIGLRLALGATAAQVFRLIVGQGVTVTALGIVIGLVSAAALTRYVGSLLFGVTPHDPATFAVVTAVFIAVAVLGFVCSGAACRPPRSSDHTSQRVTRSCNQSPTKTYVRVSKMTAVAAVL